MSAMVGEMTLSMHVAAISGKYDADRMVALVTALQRKEARERGSRGDIRVRPSISVTAAASSSTSVLTPASTSAADENTPAINATRPGDIRTSRLPDFTRVPSVPTT
eukprot:3342961-Pleurochrysis_carterae.AAC.2